MHTRPDEQIPQNKLNMPIHNMMAKKTRGHLIMYLYI